MSPAPPPAYLEFRLLTQYGSSEKQLSGHDVISFLEWCRDQPH